MKLRNEQIFQFSILNFLYGGSPQRCEYLILLHPVREVRERLPVDLLRVVNAQQLVDALNTRMMHGTMSQAMNANIFATVNAITSADPAGRTRTAIYLIATSSQYQVER